MSEWPWDLALWDKRPPPQATPSGCKHDPWPMMGDHRFYCQLCGEVGVSGKVGVTMLTKSDQPYFIARQIPTDYRAKESYFTTVLLRLCAQENLGKGEYATLKELADVHRGPIQDRCKTRRDVKRYLKYVPNGGVAQRHLTLFIRMCGSDRYLLDLCIGELQYEFGKALRINPKLRTSEYLKPFIDRPIAWRSEPQRHHPSPSDAVVHSADAGGPSLGSHASISLGCR